MKPVKILFVCNEFPPLKHGGFGMFVKDIANKLIDLGHLVAVYGQSNEVDKRTYRVTDSGVEVTIDPIVKSKGGYPAFLYEYAKSLKKFIGDEIFDVVEFGDTGGLFLFFRHPNLVVRLHNGERYLKKRALSLVVFEKLSFAIRKVKIVAVSGFIQLLFKEYFKFVHPFSKEYVVYNGIEFNKEDRPIYRCFNESKSIVYAGTLKRIKGLENVVQAFQQSRLAEQGYTLNLYGNDTTYSKNMTYWNYLQTLINESVVRLESIHQFFTFLNDHKWSKNIEKTAEDKAAPNILSSIQNE
jgi:glycosyltransferase involved in cell wall biosynthesis